MTMILTCTTAGSIRLLGQAAAVFVTALAMLCNGPQVDAYCGSKKSEHKPSTTKSTEVPQNGPLVTTQSRHKEPRIELTIYGTEGAAMPGVKVTVRDQLSKRALMAISDARGQVFFDLPGSGRYVLTAKVKDYKQAVTRFSIQEYRAGQLDIKLVPDGLISLCDTLEPGSQVTTTMYGGTLLGMGRGAAVPLR